MLRQALHTHRHGVATNLCPYCIVELVKGDEHPHCPECFYQRKDVYDPALDSVPAVRDMLPPESVEPEVIEVEVIPILGLG